MRKKGSWSDETYRARATEADTKGSSTFEGEERYKQGEALDPLVDPSKYEVIRGSNNLLVPDGKEFVLEFGVAMPVESDLDTTGSMGRNVDVAFGVLPKVQNLLVQGQKAVLRRYHTQIATGIIQDRTDEYPYLRSMFEPDNEVERQMGLLVPERDGGDNIEDYQLGLFAAAYLTKASIRDYGLKGYYFVVGDERGRDEFDPKVLRQVFGPTVLEKAFGSKSSQALPYTKDVAKKVLEDWHIFFLQVNNNPATTIWWADLLGKERVVQLARTSDLAEVQATIIGLTEGSLDLQTAGDFLTDLQKGSSGGVVARIKEAVRGIPIGLQATCPNFNKIPMAGARFKSREDIWPIGAKAPKSPASSKKGSDKKERKNWKL